MPVIINEFEVEVRDDEPKRERAAGSPARATTAPSLPLVDADLEEWRRARAERLADD